MKNLTNILSYLWLLLLMAVTACSDMEREVDEMQQQLQDADQVELTIHTQVPRMKAGTRAVNGDNLTSVTALAFDKDDKLIKVVSPTTITQNENDNNESGSFTVKVPLRTRSVHFLGNYTLNSDAIDETTASALLTPLKTTDTNNLHYWGMVTFADATALKNYSDKVNLYRDKALITLNSTIGQSDYIAGLLHYYPSGALVPSGNVVGTATIPNEVDPISHDAGNNLGTETYVYEHANNTNETHLYAICYIDGLFYKIAFATNNNGELNHFPIVRNHQYNININEIETALGSNIYEDAVAANPINNAVVKEVELSVNTDVTELYFNNEETVIVTANIPDGVSALAITAPEFDVTTTSDKVTKTSDYNYTVNSADEVEFTFTLKDGSYRDNQPVSIQFTGTAEYGYELTNPEAISITLRDNIPPLGLEIIAADPSNPTLTYGPNSNSIEDLQVKLTIPAGVTSLTFSSEDFIIRQATDKKNSSDNPYLTNPEEKDNGNIIIRTYTVNNVTEPTILPFLLRLKDGVVKEYATFTFSSSGEGLQDSSVDGRVTLTAREPDDETIYWEGYLPLDLDDNTTKLSIPVGDLEVGKILVIECTQPTNGTFEVLNNGTHFDPRLEYSSEIAEVPLTQELLNLITDKIIITGRTNADMTLLKVSMVPSVVVPDQDYEIWVNNNAWIGNNDADVAFFGYAGQNFNTGTSNSLESTFYDASADSHKSQAMVMGSDDSFTFTITGTEPRYLTLLAASNGNAPSINLLKDGNTWTTNDKNVFPYDNSYNFSGDIGANGRLICYTLEPGTYTLQRGEADYYLYYMRVSKEKPTTLTDIIQPTIDDYTFYWRGGEFGNYLKIDDNNYIVDDDNKEFVITLTDAFRNSHGIASRTLSINSMSVQIGDNNHYTANSTNYVTISNNNAGSYSYTIGQGEIEVGTGNYKFSNFYNKIVLKQPTTTQKSGINVKNSVMLKLTDNDSEVDYYTEEMTAPALMICSPLTVPLSGHRQFDFSIVAENGTWTRQGGRYEMIQQNGTSYIIVKDGDNQYDDYIHPFNPGYDYFIDWGNFTNGGNVNRSLKSMTISTNDNDVYFSYKWLGIAKSLKIPTRYNASTTTTVNHTLSAWSWENSYYSSETYPVGTRISINFTASGTVKLIAGDGRWLYIPEFSGRYPTDSNDLHMYVSSGLYEFVVGPEIKLRRVQNGMVSAEEFLSGSLSGLRIQGDGPTIESITITTPQQ